MTSDKRPDGPVNDGATAAESAGKKPYQKPAFVREQVFETMALACGKVNTTSGPCKAVRKNS